MRGITIHLEELVEEREKRRAAKAAGFALAAAIAGFLAGRSVTETRTVTAPALPAAAAEADVRVAVGRAPGVGWPAIEPIEVVRKVVEVPKVATETETEPEPEVLKAVHGLPASAIAMVDDDDQVVEPHLCISPKALLFRTKGATVEHLTISNPGTSAVAINSVVRRDDRRKTGIAVDASGCERTILSPGEHCTMTVSLKKQLGETVVLYIFNDGGAPVPLTIMAPEKS